MSQKVRMADIAEKLGISIVSVSKALSGKDGVSDDMREKIVTLAREMGYVPPMEKKKNVKNSGSIGILVADRFFSDNAFYSNLFRNILMKSNMAGYSALLEIVSPEAERTCAMPTMILNRNVDGLIFMGEISRTYLRAAIQSGLPHIMLDFYDEEIYDDCVISDNLNGSYLLTKHILSTGRTKIGFVGSIFSTSSIMDRYLGYVKALMGAGIAPRDDWRLEDRGENGKYISFTLPDEMPEAFVCNCDEVAYNLVERLKREGYEVPRDVAVAGYDDYLFAQLCDPPLTTCHVNVEDMGSAAVSQLIRKIRGKNGAKKNIVIRSKFIRRKST